MNEVHTLKYKNKHTSKTNSNDSNIVNKSYLNNIHNNNPTRRGNNNNKDANGNGRGRGRDHGNGSGVGSGDDNRRRIRRSWGFSGW